MYQEHLDAQINCPTVLISMTSRITRVTLLLHGLCSTPDELLSVHGVLSRSGLKVRHLVIPGYSFDASLDHQVALSHESWVQFVIEEVRAIRAQGMGVNIVGLSAGVTLALGVALKIPQDIDQLILLSTPLIIDGWNIPFYHFLLPLALYTPLGALWRYKESKPFGVKNERIREWIERELRQRRISQAGASVLEIAHLREHDRLRRLVLNTLPGRSLPNVLIIHAKEDEVAGLSNVSWLEQSWRNGEVRKVLLENSYHMITIDNDRAQVCEEILRCVAEETPVDK
jgi:carboxylesterase